MASAIHKHEWESPHTVSRHLGIFGIFFQRRFGALEEGNHLRNAGSSKSPTMTLRRANNSSVAEIDMLCAMANMRIT